MTSDPKKTAQAIGPYELLAPLGRGGMGEVYRAWDPRLQREVAVKVIRARSETDPDRVRRFVAEARAASALNHPNIITVFDAAVDGGTPYLVAEVIDGQPLRADLRRGPLPVKRLLDLATQIADGLAEAHAAGIVHLDLKPENIMVTRAGRIKILDFGLARRSEFQSSGGLPASHQDETASEPGLIEGTIPYMSPEQARGAMVDFRSDQFSLGLILYEMATGRSAFSRDTAARTLDAIAADEPVPLPAIAPQVPLLLWWIIERCLSKNPDDRYAVTLDLFRDLSKLRDRLADAVARQALIGPSTSRIRRTLLPVIAGALLAAVVVIWRLADEPGPDLGGLRFTPLITEAGYEGFPAFSPDGQTIAYAADMNGVLQIFARKLSAVASVPVTRSTFDSKHPFWSPDGATLFYISLAGERDGIWSVPTAGGVPMNVIENASRGAISADGRTLAFLRDEGPSGIVGAAALWYANADGSGERRYEQGPFSTLRFVEGALAFSPDGLQLGLSAVPATIGLEAALRQRQFWLIPLADRPPVRRLEWWPAAPRAGSFTWLQDSRHIVLGIIAQDSAASHLWLADLDRDRAWPLTRTPDSESYPSASKTGQIVFTKGDPDYDVIEIPLDGGAIRPLVSTARSEADPVWSPSRRSFAYVTDRAGRDEIWLRDPADPLADQALIRQSDFGDDSTMMLGAPTFSRDGRHIAFERNASQPVVWPLRIWYALVGGHPVPLVPPARDGYQSSPSWSPNSQWLAFAEWNGKQTALVKVMPGKQESLVVLRADGVANATPQWSPVGKWITWETTDAVLLVSDADGRDEQRLTTDQWLVHTWSLDGTRIYGVRQDADLRLRLVSRDIATKAERTLRDLGPSPPVNNPLKGLSLSADGQTLITSIVRMRGDVFLLEGMRLPRGFLDRILGR